MECMPNGIAYSSGHWVSMELPHFPLWLAVSLQCQCGRHAPCPCPIVPPGWILMVLAGSVGGVAVRDDPVAFAEAVDGAGAAARLFQWNLLPSTRVVMGPGECQWIPKPSCYGRWGVWQGWKGEGVNGRKWGIQSFFILKSCCSDEAPTFWHPTVLVHQGWAVEADLHREKVLKRKSKSKEPTEEESERRFYCACRTVCKLSSQCLDFFSPSVHIATNGPSA